MQNGLFQLRVEISTLVVLLCVFDFGAIKVQELKS